MPISSATSYSHDGGGTCEKCGRTSLTFACFRRLKYLRRLGGSVKWPYQIDEPVGEMGMPLR